MTKEPWELTALEWECAKIRLQVSYTDQSSKIRVSGKKEGARVDEMLKLNYGVQKLDPETGFAMRIFHIDVIKKALSEGKKIPSEVLKDYPSFKKPNAQKTSMKK